MKKDITELYCFADDFCKIYSAHEAKKLLPSDKKRKRPCSMNLAEMLTIVIMHRTSHSKNFKYFYKTYVEYLHKNDFPKAINYNRFIALMTRLFMPLNILLHLLFGEKTGTYFMDSTPIKVCHAKRQSSNKVFKGIAKYSRSTMGYFYGFKLHLIINEKGEFVALQITKGNVDDRVPVPQLT